MIAYKHVVCTLQSFQWREAFSLNLIAANIHTEKLNLYVPSTFHLFSCCCFDQFIKLFFNIHSTHDLNRAFEILCCYLKKNDKRFVFRLTTEAQSEMKTKKIDDEKKFHCLTQKNEIEKKNVTNSLCTNTAYSNINNEKRVNSEREKKQFKKIVYFHWSRALSDWREEENNAFDLCKHDTTKHSFYIFTFTFSPFFHSFQLCCDILYGFNVYLII